MLPATATLKLMWRIRNARCSCVGLAVSSSRKVGFAPRLNVAWLRLGNIVYELGAILFVRCEVVTCHSGRNSTQLPPIGSFLLSASWLLPIPVYC